MNPTVRHVPSAIRDMAWYTASPERYRAVMEPTMRTAPADALALRPQWALWWAVGALWWLLQAGLLVSTGAARRFDWHADLLQYLTDAASWIPTVVVLCWIAHRFPYARPHRIGRGALYVAAALAVAAYRSTLFWLVNPLGGWIDPGTSLLTSLSLGLANNVTRSLALIGVGHAFLFAQRDRLRHTQVARAELQFLRAQLHPHFLFNALNAISGTVRSDPERARTMIARLGVLLRRALDHTDETDGTVQGEIELLEAYLDIEQVRFGDRLQVVWTIAAETLHARMPSLLLQPIVENAVRHGVAPRSAPGQVRIATCRSGNRLELVVEDDGVGFRPDPSEVPGVGLTNTRSRLQHAYGSDHRFNISPVEPRGVRVEISLPWRMAAAT
jgi:two-component system, LytTR family, sensor kinase